MKNRKDRGFTIVELLIVIVVIGILAAIVVVAYVGITQRANSSAAKSNAESVRKVAEAYNADTGAGSYPTTAQLTGWTTGVTRIPAGVSVVTTTLSATHAAGGTIQYLVDSSSPTRGACVGYWDASLATPAAAVFYLGTATTYSNAATPTCN